MAIKKDKENTVNPRIMQCTCQHEFQDKRYGKRNRVHNTIPKLGGTKYRCTVCLKEK